jgi:hypothetical protein
MKIYPYLAYMGQAVGEAVEALDLDIITISIAVVAFYLISFLIGMLVL